ncbi:hypothetical protein HNQ71_006597 [Mesorhizobium sangaii]|uniref:Uncharacterized protein n=1 Tax=Mesorhizobium sangaii TaxID=505389 RepID=A0A841PMJ4_9HYPH|nr:hypothetical protein [Mesorhizobium sangaii]
MSNGRNAYPDVSAVPGALSVRSASACFHCPNKWCGSGTRCRRRLVRLAELTAAAVPSLLMPLTIEQGAAHAMARRCHRARLQCSCSQASPESPLCARTGGINRSSRRPLRGTLGCSGSAAGARSCRESSTPVHGRSQTRQRNEGHTGTSEIPTSGRSARQKQWVQGSLVNPPSSTGRCRALSAGFRLEAASAETAQASLKLRDRTGNTHN